MRGRFERNLVTPIIVNRGWRPSEYTPVDPVHLRARFGYDEEEGIKRAALVLQAHAMVSLERLALLWQQVRYLDRYNIPGVFVECGVWRGGSCGMMALAHNASVKTPRRHLHLFDSFQGLPEPIAEVDGAAAVEWAGGRASGNLRSIGQCVSPLEDSRQLLEQQLGYPKSLIHYHVGWFQQSMAADAPLLGDIALLRLDGDWYESTKLCLQSLYPKVVKYGVVVIDDYGHWPGCRRAVDEFLAELGKPVMLHHVDYAARCWVKPD